MKGGNGRGYASGIGSLASKYQPPSTQHNIIHNTTSYTTSHGDTDRERRRKMAERERREDGRGETRQDNRRPKKTGQHERRERRQMINFQCGGAWPFLFDGVLCLIHPVNDRVFSLLNRVNYSCSLISFSALWLFNSFLISANYLFYAVAVFKIFFYFFLVMQLQFPNFSELFNYAATVFFRS